MTTEIKPGETGETKEELELKKLMKERSCTLLGQCLPQLTRICLPKCMNARETHIEPQETQCVKNCVRGLHKTHFRVFQKMLDFEAKQEREQERQRIREEREEREREQRDRELQREAERERLGMVKM